MMRFLITTHADPKHMPVMFLDPGEIVAGPNYNKVKINGRIKYLGMTPGRSDFREMWNKIPEDQKPNVVIIHADATNGCVPVYLPENTVNILMVGGATHLFESPIRSMVNYALANPFKAVFVWSRHNAHFFHEAGVKHVFWMPGLIMGIPPVRKQEGPRRKVVTTFGQAGQYHPRRIRLYEALKKSGVPFEASLRPRIDGLENFQRTLIVFNASLNGEFNLRIFEASSQGAMILTDELRPQLGLDLFFRDGESMVTYRDEKELVEKAAYYIAHPEEAERIGARGKEIYDRYFTTAARRKTFLGLLRGENVPDEFQLINEPRCRLPSVADKESGDRLMNRIALYEWLQERNRIDENVDVYVADETQALVVSDISDLNRVNIRLGARASESEGFVKLVSTLGAKFEKGASVSRGGSLLLADISSVDNDVMAEISAGKYKAVYIANMRPENKGSIEDVLDRLGMRKHKNIGGLFVRTP